MPHDYSEEQQIQKSTANFMETKHGWKSLLPNASQADER